MILPDINLLVYAYSRRAPHHDGAKKWWEDLLNSDELVALPWVTSLGFIRLMTHRAVLVAPLEPQQAVRHVRTWLSRPNVETIDPGPSHLTILERLLGVLGVDGNLTTDAHLAAIAIEHQCELHSTDTDFARFPGLTWRNPLDV